MRPAVLNLSDLLSSRFALAQLSFLHSTGILVWTQASVSSNKIARKIPFSSCVDCFPSVGLQSWVNIYHSHHPTMSQRWKSRGPHSMEGFLSNVNPGKINPWLIGGYPPEANSFPINGTPPINQPYGLSIRG